MKEKKSFSLIFLIFLLSAFLSYHIYYYVEEKINNNKVDNYLIIDEENNDYQEKIVKKDGEDYLGIIFIPKINLKKGFYRINSQNNDVNKNIQLLNADMPNEKGGMLVLAAHRGNSYVSFFNDLYKVSLDDEIYIYYDNIKYTYIVDNIYEEEKNGTISVNKNIKENILVLTTCSVNKNKQLIIIAKLYMK